MPGYDAHPSLLHFQQPSGLAHLPLCAPLSEGKGRVSTLRKELFAHLREHVHMYALHVHSKTACWHAHPHMLVYGTCVVQHGMWHMTHRAWCMNHGGRRMVWATTCARRAT